MSANSTLQGFSVSQPALGSALQFIPALGTPELDALMDAFLPGPASIQDKRATVSMDFCEYARRTGETFRFYPVYSAAESLQDSGYGSSSFGPSPVVSEAGYWGPSAPLASASASAQPQLRTESWTGSGRKSSNASSRSGRNEDFSHLPGMKIMTRDGVDVTNSASRAGKTKEQRDHAHLMRIIKACDACRRKKIRCDPSHKKRTASHSQSPPAESPNPAKKARRTTTEQPAEAPLDTAFTGASFPDNAATTPVFPVDGLSFPEAFEESWDQFVQYDDEPGLLPPDYDFVLDPHGYFSPSTGSSTSPQQPFTPASAGPSPLGVSQLHGVFISEASSQETTAATLPYLDPAALPGANYLDFNLYSPASSFLDEEPQILVQSTKTEISTLAGQHLSQSDTGLFITARGLSVNAAGLVDNSYVSDCAEDGPLPQWNVPGGAQRESLQQSVTRPSMGLGAFASHVNPQKKNVIAASRGEEGGDGVSWPISVSAYFAASHFWQTVLTPS